MAEKSPHDRALDKDQQRREKCPNQIGKYLVGGIIGKGGFGSVYRALDQEKALLVAIKQMSASVLGSGDLGSIESEINLLSKLKHRNIVKYIDSIRTEQHLNIVLEYIEGGSLAGIVKKFHAIPEGLCAIYTLQILLGLQYLHSQGVVHRDIKGANVLVTKKGIVKLADFGVATKLSEVDNSKRCVVGTPYWMAPEIVEMSSPTPACDIWSVGGTVVEMITENPPYFHLPQVSALYRIVSDPHPPLPECISQQLESFLLACWEKNPSLRAGAGDLLQHEWIQVNKQHTIDLTRTRKRMATPMERERDDDDEDIDEDAEAVESFMATVAGGKDLSVAFLANTSQGAVRTGLVTPRAGDEVDDDGAGAMVGDMSPAAFRPRKSMPMSPPRVTAPSKTQGLASGTAPGIGTGTAEGAAAMSPKGACGLSATAQALNSSCGLKGLCTGVALEDGSEAEGGLNLTAGNRPSLGGVVPSRGSGAGNDEDDMLTAGGVEIGMGAGLVSQEPITAGALAASSSKVAASATSSSNVGEYHFFFLDYFQKMDQQRTLDAANAAAAVAATAAAVGGGIDGVGVAEGQPQQQTPPPLVVQSSSVPRRLFSRAGSSRLPLPHAACQDEFDGGDHTPLPPTPEESAAVGRFGPPMASMGPSAGPFGGIVPAHAQVAPGQSAAQAAAAVATAAMAGQRDAAEIKQLLGKIKPFEEPETLIQVCKRLTHLMQQKESNCSLVVQHGAVPIVEMLQVPDPALLRVVLKMVNQLMDGSQVSQEVFATVGLIPGVIKFARSQDLPALRREAAHFISRLCNTSPRSLQMLVACGGLEALADLAAHDYYNNRDLVWLALDALVRIFEHADQNGRVNDFCRILAKHGLCGHLCVLIDTLAGDIRERAAQYLKVVVDLLLAFAKEGDAIVKVYMAKQPHLEGFISALEYLPQDLSVQVFKTFKWLAQEPSVLNMLENAGVVPVLVTQLAALTAEDTMGEEKRELSKDPCGQCLLALFYLCKLARPRQEQSALAGIVPVLQSIVERGHGLKVYAFVMLSDLTSASLATRRILWHSGGVGLLVRSLDDPDLQTFALEALVGWIGVKEHRADWCERLEGVLLREGGDFVPQLLALFRYQDASVFMKVLEQLVKLARLSERLVAALAHSDIFFEVTALRLQARGLQPQQQQHWPAKRSPPEAASSPVSPTPAPDGDANPSGGERIGAGDVAEATQIECDVSTATASPSAPPSATTAVRIVGTAGAGAGAGVVRQESLPPSGAPDGFVPDDDVVRARKNLLVLLLRICEIQNHSALAALCVRHELPTLIKAVLLEEKRRERVILCDFASQLLELFRRALSAEATM